MATGIEYGLSIWAFGTKEGAGGEIGDGGELA